MNRAVAILMALFLMAAPALAEVAGVAPGSAVPEGTVVKADLDGDGASEAISWTKTPQDYDEAILLSVALPDGGTATYQTDIYASERVYILDLDGDGVLEILISGDVMSDDYYTYCLRLQDGALYEVLFPDAERGDNTPGYFKWGYGLLTAVEGDRLTLTGSQDVLGTWMASRTVKLTAFNRFEFDDDGLWRRSIDDLDDPDLWEYAALTTVRELPYLDADGKPAVLAPGEKLMITASDKRDAAWFITPEGVTGTLALSENYDSGWGHMIDGVPESDCFEMLPYAD